MSVDVRRIDRYNPELKHLISGLVVNIRPMACLYPTFPLDHYACGRSLPDKRVVLCSGTMAISTGRWESWMEAIILQTCCLRARGSRSLRYLHSPAWTWTDEVKLELLGGTLWRKSKMG